MDETDIFASKDRRQDVQPQVLFYICKYDDTAHRNRRELSHWTRHRRISTGPAHHWTRPIDQNVCSNQLKAKPTHWN